MTESTAYKIGNSLQSALDFLVCNRTVLRKYEEPMKGIYVNYNSFMNTLREVQHGKLSIETDTKEGKEMRLKLDEFKNNIFRYFNEIDELYFIQKRRKALTILTYAFNEMIPIFRLHSSPVDLLLKRRLQNGKTIFIT